METLFNDNFNFYIIFRCKFNVNFSVSINFFPSFLFIHRNMLQFIAKSTGKIDFNILTKMLNVH